MLELIKSKGKVAKKKIMEFEDANGKLHSLKQNMCVFVKGNVVEFNHNPIKRFDIKFEGIRFVQEKDKIFKLVQKEDKKTKELEWVYGGTVLYGNINNYYVLKDELGLKEDEIHIFYYDYVLKSEKEYTGSLDDISSALQKHNPKMKKGLFSDLLIALAINNQRIKYYASVNGYYLNHYGYLSWNPHPFDDMDRGVLEDTIVAQAKALKEFLEYLERSSGSEVWYKVCKLILLSPFKWFFNSINYQAGVKSVLLGGEVKNGKTETTSILLRMWYPKDVKVLTKAGTDASMRIELNNYSTLPVLYDEAYKILRKPDVQETLKQCAFNCDISGTADINNQGKIMEYKAFHTYYFATNKTNKIFDGLNRRLIFFSFDDELQDVDVEYYNSVLDNQEFNMIGYLFAQELSEFYQLEYLKKYDANTLTNILLKKMVEKYRLGDCFDKLLEVNPYKDTDQSIKYNPDQECLNSLEKMYYRFIDKQEDIDFTDAIVKLSSENAWGFKYIPRADMFKIKGSKLIDMLKHYNKGNSVNLTRMFNLREEIDEPVVVKEINSTKISFEPNTVYFYTDGNTTKLKSERILNDTYLFSSELIKILFNVQ